MKTFSLLLCFLLLAVVAPTVSAREKRIVDQFRSLAGRVADFVWNDPVRYWSQKIGDLFKDDTPGWRNGYFYRIPDGLKNLTLADYYRMNNAKPTTREELRRHAEQGLVLLQDDEPEAGDPLPEKYHFFDQYPQCLKEEWNQNTCGSCWAFAAATSMTHRLCKAIVDAGYHPPGRDEEDRLSPQQILSCNPYDSGCKGGQTYHAHLVIAQQYIQPVHCSPYLSWDGQRHPEDCPKMRETCAAMGRGKKGSGWGGRRDRRAAIRVTGATPKIIFGEEALMRAIHTGGPVTVTMKTPARFIGASGKGVFKRGPDGPWLEKKEPGATVLHSWHAVSISGWGVENGEKYWILENSWGGVYDSKIPNHNKGFLKVLRGANDMLIETNMNIVQDPLIWNDKNERVSVKDGWWRPDQGKFDAELGIRSRKFADEQSNDNDRAREAIDREAARVIEEAKEYLAEKSA